MSAGGEVIVERGWHDRLTDYDTYRPRIEGGNGNWFLALIATTNWSGLRFGRAAGTTIGAWHWPGGKQGFCMYAAYRVSYILQV
jgi:hypothetical protein